MLVQAAPKVERYTLRPETAQDADAIARVLDRAFGPGRFAKVSERVRERLAGPVHGWSPVAVGLGGEVVGCCRQYAIAIGATPAVFLGPLAVDPDAQGTGLGAALVQEGLIRLPAPLPVVLVGAAGFFAPMGFVEVPPGQIGLPAPVDPRRLLWRLPAGLEPPPPGPLSPPPAANPT